MYYKLSQADLERDPTDLYNVSGENFPRTEKLKDCVLSTVINGLTYVKTGVRDVNQNRQRQPNDDEVALWGVVFAGKYTYTQDEINEKLNAVLDIQPF